MHPYILNLGYRQSAHNRNPPVSFKRIIRKKKEGEIQNLRQKPRHPTSCLNR